MKVFFDTNVYVAEALLVGAAEQIVIATIEARWRIFTSSMKPSACLRRSSASPRDLGA